MLSTKKVVEVLEAQYPHMVKTHVTDYGDVVSVYHQDIQNKQGQTLFSLVYPEMYSDVKTMLGAHDAAISAAQI